MIVTVLHRIIRNPPLVIFLSYMSLTFLGAVLLSFDISHINKGAFSFIDAFFTSASAVTVTGLIVKDTSQFTLFGHWVILALFQLGGVGIMMSFAFLFVLFKKHLKLPTQKMMKEVLDADVVSEVIHIIKFVVLVSFVAELIGAALFFIRFKQEHSFFMATFYSLFHSVSVFVGAGFTLYSDNFVRFQDDLFVNIVTMSLIVVGSLGFIVYLSIRTRFIALVTGVRPLRKVDMSSKIILLMTILFLFGGAAVLFLLEANNLNHLDTEDLLLVSSFQSVSVRIAGFNTIDIGDFTPASRLLLTILMFIGGAPGSVAGGVKLTTIFLIFVAVYAFFREKKEVVIWGRSIMPENIFKAFSIVLVSLFGLMIMQFTLLLAETFDFDILLFELVSAFGNSGLSLGFPSQFSDTGKITLVISMFFGRLGPLVIFYLLSKRESVSLVRYPKERVIIG